MLCARCRRRQSPCSAGEVSTAISAAYAARFPTNNVAHLTTLRVRGGAQLASQKNAAMSAEADEVARLKAELASLQQETAALEKKPKKKRKKEKKKRKSTEDDEAAKLRAELEAVDAETAALTGAPPPRKKEAQEGQENEGRCAGRGRAAGAQEGEEGKARGRHGRAARETRLRRRPALRRHRRKRSELF